MNGRPNDQRGFLHKKIFGIAGKVAGLLPIPGFISTGLTALGGIGGNRTTTRRGTQIPTGSFRPPRQRQPTAVVPTTFRPTQTFEQAIPGGRSLTPPTMSITRRAPPRPKGITIPPIVPQIFETIFGGRDDDTLPTGACPPPLILNPATGNCISTISPRGAEVFGGNATLGQYGAGVVAESVIRDIAVCPPKHVLGDDGVCYKGLANRNRMYPKGRAPLLTGGEMRAITTAGRAAKKLEAKQKTLQRLGLMKKPARGRVRLPPHQHQIKVT